LALQQSVKNRLILLTFYSGVLSFWLRDIRDATMHLRQ